MEIALTVGVVVVVFLWFWKGASNTHSKRMQKEQQEFYDSISKNEYADDLLNDDERVQHVQDKFND